MPLGEIPQNSSGPAMGSGFGGVLWMRKGLIAGITIALMAATIGGASFMKRTYSAEALLQVDSRVSTLLSGKDLLTPLSPESGALKSDIDVIRSPAFAKKIIESLKLAKTPEFLDAIRPSAFDNAKTFVFNWLKWPTHVTPIDRFRIDQEKIIAHFLANLDVAYEARSYTIRIRYSSRMPSQAAAIANAIAKTYADSQLQAKYAVLREANSWFDERLTGLREKLQASETRLAKYREEHHLGSERGPSVTQQQLSELNAQLILATGEDAKMLSRVQEAEGAAWNGRLESSPDVLSSPVIQKLREQDVVLSRKAADLAFQYGTSYPRLGEIKAEISENGRKIHDETLRILGALKSDAKAAQAQETLLERGVEALKQEMAKNDFAEVQLNMDEREVEANRTLFESFLQKSNSTTDLEQLQRSDVRVASPALVPGKASTPSTELIIGVAFVCSLIFSISIALLLQRFDKTIPSMEVAERLLGMSGLGWLPLIRRKIGSPIDLPVQSPFSPYSESLRSIATRMQIGLARRYKVILVVSAAPTEGKTTFAVSYARTLASAGKKCLLVDADFRRPSIHRQLTGNDGPGLCENLAGIASLRDSIQRDEKTGLHFISAGRCQDNPLRQLVNAGAGRFVLQVRDEYDAIVIDAAPLLAVSDAMVFAEKSDLVILTIHAGKTPARMVAKAAARLRDAGITSISFVLTQVNISRLSLGADERYTVRYQQKYAKGAKIIALKGAKSAWGGT